MIKISDYGQNFNTDDLNRFRNSGARQHCEEGSKSATAAETVATGAAGRRSNSFLRIG